MVDDRVPEQRRQPRKLRDPSRNKHRVRGEQTKWKRHLCRRRDFCDLEAQHHAVPVSGVDDPVVRRRHCAPKGHVKTCTLRQKAAKRLNRHIARRGIVNALNMDMLGWTAGGALGAAELLGAVAPEGEADWRHQPVGLGHRVRLRRGHSVETHEDSTMAVEQHGVLRTLHPARTQSNPAHRDPQWWRTDSSDGHRPV